MFHTVIPVIIIVCLIALIGVGVKSLIDHKSPETEAETLATDVKTDATKVETDVVTDIHHLDAAVVTEVGKLEGSGTLAVGTTQNLVDAHTAQVAAVGTAIATGNTTA